jgi:AcrR family transcriptional regulator
VTSVAERGAQTRERLIVAAVTLMGEHGIEGVELAEIQRAAGQRNSYAIGYHFGDRDGLVSAIGVRYRTPANEERNRRLDELERSGNLTVPALAAALVEPLARNLHTAEGRSWLLVLAEAAHRLGTPQLLDSRRANVDSITRLTEHLQTLLPGTRINRRRRIAQAILVTPTLLADIARSIDRTPPTAATIHRHVADTTTFITNALTDHHNQRA